MIALPKDPARPLHRLVQLNGKPMVVELTERTILLRYPRARHPVLRTTWGALLYRFLRT